jgi:hypothetical protein
VRAALTPAVVVASVAVAWVCLAGLMVWIIAHDE